MSIRLKIAQWLAPGVFRRMEALEELKDVLQLNHKMAVLLALDRGVALRNIAALRTPSCAHIGKRMADIAETALREGE